jgi:ABC-2 type transport system ATP-binding protein
VIEVEALRAGYRAGFTRKWKEILNGVSFHIPAGSIAGYLGINGSGKTTTIKVLVGINRPSGGTARVGGHPVGSSRSRMTLGYFPEAPFFYDGLSGVELLAFYGKLSGMEPDLLRKRSLHLLGEVGLGHATEQPVRGYSKGMRQRLGLAQALLHDPQLLILDEPLDGLDPMGRLHLRQLIEAQKEQGRTVFFSSHVLTDVEAVCDHLVVLDGGKIAYEGTTAGITADAPRPVELQFSGLDDEDALARVAAAAEAELTPGAEGSREVLCSGPEQANRALDAVRAAGGTIRHLTQRRISLEEHFLQRYGKEPAGEAPVAAETVAK